MSLLGACVTDRVTDSWVRVDSVLSIPDDVVLMTYAVISCLRSLARYGARLISRLWLRTPASTLPTRFPAALGIGHGSACGLANAPH